MNTVSIIALNLGLISRGIRNVEIIDVTTHLSLTMCVAG